MNSHNRLYGSHMNVSKHVAYVAQLARDRLASLVHANGQLLVRFHHSFLDPPSSVKLQDPGPIIGFSLLDPHGSLIGHRHLENLLTIGGFQIRTGGDV